MYDQQPEGLPWIETCPFAAPSEGKTEMQRCQGFSEPGDKLLCLKSAKLELAHFLQILNHRREQCLKSSKGKQQHSPVPFPWLQEHCCLPKPMETQGELRGFGICEGSTKDAWETIKEQKHGLPRFPRLRRCLLLGF